MKDKAKTNLPKRKFHQKVLRRTRNFLIELDNMLLRWVGHIPSHLVRRFCYRLNGMHIGKRSALQMGTIFYDIRNIRIGENTIIGERAVLDGRAKLIIGSYVDIASEVMIYNAHHDIDDLRFIDVYQPVVIEDYVFIGQRAIIVPGVTLGKGSLIGAG